MDVGLRSRGGAGTPATPTIYATTSYLELLFNSFNISKTYVACLIMRLLCVTGNVKSSSNAGFCPHT